MKKGIIMISTKEKFIENIVELKLKMITSGIGTFKISQLKEANSVANYLLSFLFENNQISFYLIKRRMFFQIFTQRFYIRLLQNFYSFGIF